MFYQSIKFLFNQVKIATLFSLVYSSAVFAIDKSVLKQQADMFQQGYDQVQLGQLDSALQSWKKLEQSPEIIPELKRALQNNIAVVLMKQGRYEEAKNRLDQALKADSQVATTIENLNKLYAYDAQKAYKKIFKDTKVTAPRGELLYFDVKRAELPNKQVITDIRDADDVRLVIKATEEWRQAWSNQDIQAYLSLYSDSEFIPKNGVSFETWKQGRYGSVQGPKFIKVETDNLQVTPISKDMIRVSFYQRYHSDRFKDDIDKVLLWKKTDGQWKIVQEVVIYGNG